MTPTINHQVRLAARPAAGLPTRNDWQFTEEPLPQPADGEVLVQVIYLSLDPAMRGWMNAGRSYVAPVEIGEVMRAAGAGRVIASRAEGFAEGDFVSGIFGMQEYAVAPGKRGRKIDGDVASLPVHLGALGLPGMTAYVGLLDIGRPQRGQTVVVSGAAGAVGSVVGQIAKIQGCRVVGIAGGAEKCRHLVETLGFDEAIDYKSADLRKALRAACPQGVDVFFDNVGGEVLDTVLMLLARNARVVICGAISIYNATEKPAGPANYLQLLVNRASMTGMVVFDHEARFPEATAAISGWIADGRLKTQTHLVKGLENFPEALLRLFAGDNIGKFVLQVAEL